MKNNPDNAVPTFKEQLANGIGIKHNGANFVLDKGLPLDLFTAYLNTLSSYIKMVKLGWTTWSLFDNEELIQKIKIWEQIDISMDENSGNKLQQHI